MTQVMLLMNLKLIETFFLIIGKYLKLQKFYLLNNGYYKIMENIFQVNKYENPWLKTCISLMEKSSFSNSPSVILFKYHSLFMFERQENFCM